MKRDPELGSSDAKRLTTSRQIDRLLERVSAYLGMLVVTAFVAVSASSLLDWALGRQKVDTPDLPAKIEILTESLRQSSSTIGEIEKEIAERRNLVEQLQADARTAQELAKLSKEQAEAVALTLQSKIREEESGQFWTQQLFALFYIVIGMFLDRGFTWASPRVRAWWRSWSVH